MGKLRTIIVTKYPEFVSLNTETESASDKRALIVKPGEYVQFSDLKLSYTELRDGPRIIRIDDLPGN